MLSVVHLFLVSVLCVWTVNARIAKDAIAYQKLISVEENITVPEALILSTDNGYTKQSEFCWHAALLSRYSDKYFCGGALIDPQWIITAAHCVENRTPAEITVRLGEWGFNSTSGIPDQRDYAILNMSFHPNFNTIFLLHDLVLLKLAQPADTTLANICVARRWPTQTDFTHKVCVAAGWGGRRGNGYLPPAEYSPRLKLVPARVWPHNDCEAQLRTVPGYGPKFELPASFLCASAVGRQRVCRGYPGGALVCDIGGSYQMAGLIVEGEGCRTLDGLPAFFKDLQQHQSWMNNVMQNNNA